MRARVLKVVISFAETTDALDCEECLKEAKIKGRLIPLPSAISAGCGLAFSAPLEEQEAIENMIKEGKIKAECIYQFQLLEGKKKDGETN